MRLPAGENIVNGKSGAALAAILVDDQVKITSQQDYSNALGREPARCGSSGISFGGGSVEGFGGKAKSLEVLYVFQLIELKCQLK